ncbi:EAL domain-containing protein, partial [Ruminococcaceae bacterium OttesenSCG-928-I18]|nr:EAL domain-containing protein [Ruminococcaceae bacterium OttesenSCG-928-I18]
ENGLYCTISAGAAGYPYDSQNFGELSQFTENALNNAKRLGKNNIIFFSRDAYEDHLLQVGLRESLQQSVSNDYAGFEVYYQPQVSVKTGNIIGAEALLRWENNKYGKVSPTIFIPILEQAGLIGQVGRWVLDKAMEQCRIWRRFIPNFVMNINLSYQQFETDDIPGYVHKNLNRLGLPGQAIILELVESLQMQDFRYFNEIFAYLNRIGVAVAIDDFGTGYSSLGYFKELNINQIKIDRTFVARMRSSAYDYDLVRFIVGLAHRAGTKVCVEGVETLEEAQALLPLQPDTVQGFYFGRPAGASDFEERFLDHWGEGGKVFREYTESHETEEHVSATSLFSASEETFVELLDELDEIVYISEPESYKVLYLNRTGRTMLGVQDYENMLCHELFNDRDSTCANCSSKNASRDRFIMRECYNSNLGGKFLMRQKLIPWKGDLALLAMSTDLAQDISINTESRIRLEADRTLRGCMRTLAEEEDVNTALGAVLKSVGEFYRADRAYLFSFAPGTDIASTTHEWCRPGVTPEYDAFPQELFSVAHPAWYALFKSGRPVVTGNSEQFEKNFPKDFEAFCRYEPRSMILAPLLLKGELIGFAGVDNPGYGSENPDLLTNLSTFLAQQFGLYRLEEELFRSRYVDASTGLLNRERYLRDIGALDGETPEYSLGAVYIEASGYKQLNLQKGHEVGDLMLQQLASQIQTIFEGDSHYRIGADEFLILCEGARETDLAEACSLLKAGCKKEPACEIRLGYSFAAIGADIQTLLEQAYTHMAADSDR